MIRCAITGGGAGWIFASTLPLFEAGDTLNGSIGVVLAVVLFLSPFVRLA